MWIGSTHAGDVLNPKEADDHVIVCGPGQKLHRHRAKLLQAGLRPVLQTRLRGEKEERRGEEERREEKRRNEEVNRLLADTCLRQDKSLCQQPVMARPSNKTPEY